ncbi:hypothetical protein [Escherichia coli]
MKHSKGYVLEVQDD